MIREFLTDTGVLAPSTSEGATDPAPGPLPRLVPGATGAECVDGVVMVDPAVSDTLKIKALPGGSMHFHDLSLFYENVRENAVLRAKAFVRKR